MNPPNLTNCITHHEDVCLADCATKFGKPNSRLQKSHYYLLKQNLILNMRYILPNNPKGICLVLKIFTEIDIILKVLLIKVI